MKKVLITGASGNVGAAVLAKLIEHKDFICTVLLRAKKTNYALAKSLEKKSVKVFFGDLENVSDCEKFIAEGDYILHFAGIIPPTADLYPELSYTANVLATQNLLDAAKKINPQIKFLYSASYAEYGSRDYTHAWGRVGDPLIPAIFDYYAVTKILAESAVISSQLTWLSLRLPGVLYDNILRKNISSTIMFSTPWNTPIEWTTDRSLAHLVYTILKYDSQRRLDKSFWRTIYNIGDGADARTTGFGILERGFKMMGKSVKYFFKPNWNPLKNFHCLWLEDSYKVHSFFDAGDVKLEGVEAFFSNLEKKNWYFRFGKPFAFFIRKCMIAPLLKQKTAPLYWITHNDIEKLKVYYGSVEYAKNMSENWDRFYLLCENKNPKTGEFLDYENLKNIESAKHFRLNHGYDESKTQLTLADLQEAARFRGGACLAEKFPESQHTAIMWKCSEGHKFELSVFAVLKAGFWCNECLDCKPDGFHNIAKNIPFYKQVLDS